uniref:DUF4150 domain-containing protein n=1 Tax=Panagrellus redivivus TaxID=6233 RepID=A0A7E4W350_PANRE
MYAGFLMDKEEHWTWRKRHCRMLLCVGGTLDVAAYGGEIQTRSVEAVSKPAPAFDKNPKAQKLSGGTLAMAVDPHAADSQPREAVSVEGREIHSVEAVSKPTPAYDKNAKAQKQLGGTSDMAVVTRRPRPGHVLGWACQSRPQRQSRRQKRQTGLEK